MLFNAYVCPLPDAELQVFAVSEPPAATQKIHGLAQRTVVGCRHGVLEKKNVKIVFAYESKHTVIPVK